MARIREAGGWTGGAPADRMAQYMAGEHNPQHALMPRVVYVAAEDESLLGYVAGHLTRRYHCDGELEWIYVLPERRRSGVASGLLQQLATWFAAQNALRVCVDVEPANTTARAFYSRHGAVILNPHWLVWPDIKVVLDRESPSSL